MCRLIALFMFILVFAFAGVANEEVWKLAWEAAKGRAESKEWDVVKERVLHDPAVDLNWHPPNKPKQTLALILKLYQEDFFEELMEKKKSEAQKPHAEEFKGWDLTCAGKGHSGLVWRAHDPTTNSIVAIKTLKRSEVGNEIEFLRKVKAPHIIEFLGTIEKADVIYVLTAFLPGGSLLARIRQNSFLDEQTCKRFMSQLLQGLDHLHDLRICHGDVKPDNILLDGDRNIKLIDFGLSSLFTPGEAVKQTPKGTVEYAAPEILCGDPFNGAAVDVWASGVVLFAMATGKLPFRTIGDTVSIVYEWPKDRTVAQDLVNFVKRIFQNPWTERPSVKTLCREFGNP